jgi:hypothetical protein
MKSTSVMSSYAFNKSNCHAGYLGRAGISVTQKSFLATAPKNLSLALLSVTLSFGAVIYDSGVLALKTSDATQSGKLRATGVPSDWSVQKVFPGILNPTAPYRYEAFTIPVNPFPYLQISIDDLSGNYFTFGSAYLNSYNPSSTAANCGLDVNYIGDAGRIGNYYGTDPVAFQVVVPAPETNHLVVVVSDATGLTNIMGQNFRILVEGFYDTNFNDTTPSVPEPATMALSGAGFVMVTLLLYRRGVTSGSKPLAPPEEPS